MASTSDQKYSPRPDRLSEEPSSKNAQGLFPPDACLFVGNIPTQSTPSKLEDDIVSMFSQFGKCYAKVKINSDRSLPGGFVQFEKVEHAIAALQLAGASLNDRPLRVERARGERFREERLTSAGTALLCSHSMEPPTLKEAYQALAGLGALEGCAVGDIFNASKGQYPNACTVTFAFILDYEDAVKQLRSPRSVHSNYTLHKTNLPGNPFAGIPAGVNPEIAHPYRFGNTQLSGMSFSSHRSGLHGRGGSRVGCQRGRGSSRHLFQRNHRPSPPIEAYPSDGCQSPNTHIHSAVQQSDGNYAPYWFSGGAPTGVALPLPGPPQLPPPSWTPSHTEIPGPYYLYAYAPGNGIPSMVPEAPPPAYTEGAFGISGTAPYVNTHTTSYSQNVFNANGYSPYPTNMVMMPFTTSSTEAQMMNTLPQMSVGTGLNVPLEGTNVPHQKSNAPPPIPSTQIQHSQSPVLLTPPSGQSSAENTIKNSPNQEYARHLGQQAVGHEIATVIPAESQSNTPSSSGSELYSSVETGSGTETDDDKVAEPVSKNEQPSTNPQIRVPRSKEELIALFHGDISSASDTEATVCPSHKYKRGQKSNGKVKGELKNQVREEERLDTTRPTVKQDEALRPPIEDSTITPPTSEDNNSLSGSDCGTWTRKKIQDILREESQRIGPPMEEDELRRIAQEIDEERRETELLRRASRKSV
ncbi:hypothetical protein N7532_000866 [Penicillium argentinense]|uniref:RRM domain-containing protein n=1 Tax=Penicillium argentinense TaxID=1131581 RepID=A0A9W9G6A2_9EURO|nr:uncharacterized protein N7532_000866 [Penicillium argentinense]KAJ5112821.1 hypothetical protein N7532_000866 [Penicillium argentinense]